MSRCSNNHLMIDNTINELAWSLVGELFKFLKETSTCFLLDVLSKKIVTAYLYFTTNFLYKVVIGLTCSLKYPVFSHYIA